MPDRVLRTVLVGEDRSLSRTLEGSASKGEKAGERIGKAFSKAGQLVGGEAGEALSKIGETIDEVGGKTHKLQAVGAGLAGIGATLTAIGEHEKVASQQLSQAITNTGHDAEEFEGQIEKTVSNLEKYGYTADHTKGALQRLTQATKDPEKAITLMGEAADLAAAKHTSLETAADTLGKLLNGKGTRILAQYGVQIVHNADGTSNWAKTNDALARSISGQADASVTGFTGKLKHLKAEIEDQVALFGQHYGPAITTAGVAIIAFGPIVTKGARLLRGMGTAAVESSAATVTANEAAALSEGELAAATAAASTTIVAANTRITASNRTTLLSRGKLGVGLGGAALAGALAIQTAGDQGEQSSLIKELRGAYEEETHSSDLSAKALLKWAAASKTAAAYGPPLKKILGDLHITSNDLANGISGTDEQFDAFADGLKKTGKYTGDTKAYIQDLHGAYKNTADATADLAEKTKDAGEALHNEAVEGVKVKTAMDDLSTSLDRLNKRMDDKEAHLSFLDSIDALNASLKENGHTLSENTAKGRDNIRAVFDSIKAAQADAQAVLDRTHSGEKAKAQYDKEIGTIRQVVAGLHLNRQQLANVKAALDAMPTFKRTTLDVETTQARARIRLLNQQLDALAAGRNIPVNVTVSGALPGAGVHLNAAGTSSALPGWSWVGERLPNGQWSPGAELVNFRGGEQVLSARQAAVVGGTTRGYAAGTGPTPGGGVRRVRVELDLGARSTLTGWMTEIADESTRGTARRVT